MFRPLVCLNSLRIQHDPDGPGDHFGHPHFRSDRLPHGSGVTGSCNILVVALTPLHHGLEQGPL